MPYEVSFTRPVRLLDREEYINECCVGGDAVVNQLLPSVQRRYADIQTNQEDWGWFIWFRDGKVKLAVDVFTDDPGQGIFRMHLTSRTKRFVLFDSITDTPELEELRTMVESELTEWGCRALKVDHLDRNYV
jgi:hypothetical protein